MKFFWLSPTYTNTACPAERPHTRIKGKVHVTTVRAERPHSHPHAYNIPTVTVYTSSLS